MCKEVSWANEILSGRPKSKMSNEKALAGGAEVSRVCGEMEKLYGHSVSSGGGFKGPYKDKEGDPRMVDVKCFCGL